jgi:hypothetical protein
MDGNVVDVDLALLNEMEQKIKRPFKVLDANLIGQFGLFCHIELVFHEPTYTRLGGDGASLYLLVVVSDFIVNRVPRKMFRVSGFELQAFGVRFLTTRNQKRETRNSVPQRCGSGIAAEALMSNAD